MTKTLSKPPSSVLDSQSMTPLIMSSDKPVVGKVGSYKTNDIVVFKKGDFLVAHRVIYVSLSQKYLITKGDNRLKADGKIKPSKILGKVRSVKRNNRTIYLSHIYFSQSSAYLQELKRINKAFSKNKIQYILLKGLPLHLHFDKTPPKRIYVDADFLIKKSDFSKIARLLKNLGFAHQPSSLFGKRIKNPSQTSFVKKIKPFPVVIDLHLEPAIGFTKIRNLNQLVPSKRSYPQHLFENIDLIKIESVNIPILNIDALTVYLLLHLAHHNFQGAHRMEFIYNLMKAKKVNWAEIVNIVDKYQFRSFVFPGILMLKRYYHLFIPNKHLEVLTPPLGSKLASNAIVKVVNPFNSGNRAIEGLKRFIFLLTLSPAPISEKLKTLFDKETRSYFLPTIKSFFFRMSTNFLKSRSV